MIEEEESNAAAEEGAPAWMATFADLMSLLLTFFVLILSFANMDVIKFSAAVDSLKDAFGTSTTTGTLDGAVIAAPIDFSGAPQSRLVSLNDATGSRQRIGLRREVEEVVSRLRMDNLVEIEDEQRGVVIRVVGQLLFDPGSAELRPESFVLLDEIAGLVRGISASLSIEGHTDDTASAGARFASNWKLSALRAISVLEYLTEVHGIDPQRLRVAAYGSTRPLVPNDNAEHRETNRRVEFLFEEPVENERQPATR